MAAAGSIIIFVLWIAVLLLISRFVLDWVQMLASQWRPRGSSLSCARASTPSPIRPCVLCEASYRRSAWALWLDLSPMILLIGIFILQR